VKNTAETFIANKDKPSFWLLHSLGWMTYVFIFKVDYVFFYRDFNKIGFDVFFPLVLSGLFAALLTWQLSYVYRQCWKLPSSLLITTITLSSLLVSLIWTPVKNLVMWYFYEDFDVLSLIPYPLSLTVLLMNLGGICCLCQ
jgi:two-component system LytT family sensor kinase